MGAIPLERPSHFIYSVEDIGTGTGTGTGTWICDVHQRAAIVGALGSTTVVEDLLLKVLRGLRWL